jgi:F0F1-type ATP synthase assembly protein I
VPDFRVNQQLNRGYSDGLARGIEVVLTPLLFGAFGWLLDSWLGTDPFLAIIFGTFGVIGIFAKLKLGYDRQMTEQEAGKPWTRGPE